MQQRSPICARGRLPSQSVSMNDGRAPRREGGHARLGALQIFLMSCPGVEWKTEVFGVGDRSLVSTSTTLI
jgi:hypothetical protein